MMNKLTIGWMYPDLLNLHGERGSIQALVRIGENLGVEVEIVRVVDFNDTIPFNDLDMMVFLPGEIKVLTAIREALKSQESDLKNFVESGKPLIAIGTSGMIFGKEIRRRDGSTVQGFGLLDLIATEREYVWGDDLHFRVRDNRMEVIGAQISMADVETETPLGKTIYGHGNNKTGTEGARYKNLIYTNCIGPLFVKNPWFGEDILKNALLYKMGVIRKAPYKLALESFDTTEKYTNTKK